MMHPRKYLRSCPHYFVNTQLHTIMLPNLCDKLPGKLPGSMCMVIKIRKASIEFCILLQRLHTDLQLEAVSLLSSLSVPVNHCSTLKDRPCLLPETLWILPVVCPCTLAFCSSTRACITAEFCKSGPGLSFHLNKIKREQVREKVIASKQ